MTWKNLQESNKIQAFIWIANLLTCEGKRQPNKRKTRVSFLRTSHVHACMTCGKVCICICNLCMRVLVNKKYITLDICR